MQMQVRGYYAYVIGHDGHIQNRVVILCDDDEEAKRCAQRLVDGHAVELWQEARRVAIFDPKDHLAASQERKSIPPFNPG